MSSVLTPREGTAPAPNTDRAKCPAPLLSTVPFSSRLEEGQPGSPTSMQAATSHAYQLLGASNISGEQVTARMPWAVWQVEASGLHFGNTQAVSNLSTGQKEKGKTGLPFFLWLSREEI